MKKIVFLLLALCFNVSFGQQKESNNVSESPLPYYNFGKGVGITSPDSLFQFNIRFRMQNRATFLHEDEKEDRLSAEVRRLRLRFDGYIGNPKFMYAIQLSFAPGDTGGGLQEGESLQIIRDAVVFYQLNRKWLFSFGQTKLPGNRQRVNSSGALQFTDRTINNANFNIDRDFGLQIHNTNEFKDKFSYNFRAAISTGEGRNETSNSDLGLAYTGKVELYPLGSFSKNGSFFEGDLVRESKPKLMISGAYSHNNKASKTQGQLGQDLFEKRDINSLFLDAMFKYNGWAFQTAYMSRMANNPITVNPDDSTQQSFVYVGNGMDYQLSYLFRNNYEVLGRYSYQNMDDKLKELAPNRNQYSLAINKYIWEHSFKIQAEVTYEQRQLFNNPVKNNWYMRFQVEIGI